MPELNNLLAEVISKIKENPDDVGTWFFLGLSYSDEGEHEKAIQAFEKAAKLSPEDSEVLHNLGLTYDNIGDQENALEDLVFRPLLWTKIKPVLMSRLRSWRKLPRKTHIQ